MIADPPVAAHIVEPHVTPPDSAMPIPVDPPIERLWHDDAASLPAREISAELAAAYGSALAIPLHADRPTVIVNFVSTIDGVISFAAPNATGGGEVSGFFAPDRYVMGLLRSLADVVLIGAGTLRDATGDPWSAASIYPPAADALHQRGGRLGLPPEPTTAIVTARGDIDPSHAGLNDPRQPARLLTTAHGARRIAGRPPADHVSVEVLGEKRVAVDRLVAALLPGPGVLLCEGGPHLLGELLAAGLVDELFLTVAPQVAGRAPDARRPGLAEGVAFSVAQAPWWRLAALHRSGSHLFMRYRLDRAAAGKGGAS
jgi:riboflavin biosynthesis pyrimidine reductase